MTAQHGDNQDAGPAPATAEAGLHDVCWTSPASQDDLPALEQLAGVLGDSALGQLGIYRLPEDFKLSVAMAAYNERATIEEVLRRVEAVPIPKEILVVDDGSTDGTRQWLCSQEGRPGLRVFYHEQNLGKGAALRTAFAQATGEVVVVQDADLEYDPAQYPKLIQPIVDGRADVVYGSRFKGEAGRTHLFWHRVANGILTLLSNALTNLNLTDMETGFKAFRRSVLVSIPLEQNGFGFEPEITAKVARRKYRIYELPISYAGRDYAQGKKVGLRDALVSAWCIARYWWKD